MDASGYSRIWRHHSGIPKAFDIDMLLDLAIIFGMVSQKIITISVVIAVPIHVIPDLSAGRLANVICVAMLAMAVLTRLFPRSIVGR